jgi:hypothetical protein
MDAEDFMEFGREFTVTVTPLPDRAMANAGLANPGIGSAFDRPLTEEEAVEVHRGCLKYLRDARAARNLPWWRRLLNRMRRIAPEEESEQGMAALGAFIGGLISNNLWHKIRFIHTLADGAEVRITKTHGPAE